jgi:hypothetical protein
MKNLKFSFYYYNKKQLKKLDSLLSFETNIKKRDNFFRYENNELNIK